MCLDISRPHCSLHQNFLPAGRVFPVTRTSLSSCIRLWSSYLGMVVTSTHQEHHISCSQCPYLLVAQNYWAFRVGSPRRLAFGERLICWPVQPVQLKVMTLRFHARKSFTVYWRQVQISGLLNSRTWYWVEIMSRRLYVSFKLMIIRVYNSRQFAAFPI